MAPTIEGRLAPRRSLLRVLVSMVCLSMWCTSCAGATAPTTTEPASTSTAAPAATAAPAPSMPTGPPATEDVLYNEDRRRHTLDVYLPTTEGPHPTILAIHGGRFRFNSKSLYRGYAEHLTERGIAVVSTNYRFAPNATYPAQVEDVQCALAWLHANAEDYGLDPERVVVLGGSAGGYLAAMLGAVDDRDRFVGDCPHRLPDMPLAGAVVIYGFFDFRSVDDYPSLNVEVFEGFWGTTYDELSTEQLREMSPIGWVDGSEPPFLLIHGDADPIIPSVMSERFHAALVASGVPSELVILEGAGHAFELNTTTDEANVLSLAAIEAFIEELG